MKKFLFVCLPILMLIGCATPYRPYSEWDEGGYKDTQLQEDVFQVSFEGNASISQAKASEYALRRAAELAIKHDFDYFVVESESARQKEDFFEDDAGPEVVITVRCGKGELPSDRTNTYDARDLLKRIGG